MVVAVGDGMDDGDGDAAVVVAAVSEIAPVAGPNRAAAGRSLGAG